MSNHQQKERNNTFKATNNNDVAVPRVQATPQKQHREPTHSYPTRHNKNLQQKNANKLCSV